MEAKADVFATSYGALPRIPVGQHCQARQPGGKYFDLAVVEGYEEYGELVVHLRWAMSGLTCTIPYSADTVESIDSPQKRKRTTLVDLGVVRVKKEKKSKVSDSNALDHRKTNAESNLTMDPIKAQLLKEIKDSEEVSFQSLVPHLSQLKPFLSLKIQNKFAETNAAQPLKGNCSEVTADSPVSFAHSQYQRNYGLDVQPISTPINLRATMRSYQEFGLSWLVDRYDKAIHCILADEMGLGKTIQTIALICYLKEVRNVSGTHLVVVPLSVMFNWMNECRKFCPFLRLLRVHTSSLAEAVALRTKMADIESYDVAITSYETLIQNSMQYSFQRMAWRTIVLDEGHRIKNLDTFVAKACLRLRSRFKLVLTGTPVQNNLKETFSLLHYLFPHVFDEESASIFEKCFSLNSFASKKINIDRTVLNNAHYMLRPFILRRIKTEVEQTLPPKLETMIYCPLSDMQRFWTKMLLLRDGSMLQKQFQDGGKSSDSSSNSGVLSRLHGLLAQLRKAANHPYLFPGAEKISDADEVASEDIISASGKLEILDRLLAKLEAKGHRVVLFSQFTQVLDILSDYLDYRGYNHCRLDGSTNRVMREVLINQFNRPDSDLFIFCLSTRAGGEGVNLFTADTVVLFDSDWNPQKDIQAMARVHRIGQTKPVHVYRLVSKGTVEERVVQRAQKKLFLDCMVNRGSSAQGLEIDRQIEESKASVMASDDSELEEKNLGSMLSLLKFGWNACFSPTEQSSSFSITDDMLDKIIDRGRGCNKDVQDMLEKVADPTLLEDQEANLNIFQEDAPLMALREFEGELLQSKKCVTLADISKEWIKDSTEKRVSKSRFDVVRVSNVGSVNVLKLNNYSLADGEPSVYELEAKRFSTENLRKVGAKKKARFENQDYCQLCWDGGELVCCDLCPASYHCDCLGVTTVPRMQWRCPHHSTCSGCSVKSSFLFRCTMCPVAFCEDCLSPEFVLLGSNKRWTALGFHHTMSSPFTYVYCSEACQRFDERLTEIEGDGGNCTE